MQTEAVNTLVAERHRQTWTAIHHAAAAATLEHGPDDITVAQIAAAAGISQRTFFNYFDSKEDAIVGVRSPRITGEALQMLRDSVDEPALLRVSQLVTEVARSTIGPGVDVAQRRALAAAHPRLSVRLSQVFTDSRKLVIARMVDNDDLPWAGIEGLPGDPLEARALVLLAGAVVTLAWTNDSDFFHADRDHGLNSAIDTFRKVISTSL